MPGEKFERGRREALIIAAERFDDPGLGALRSPSRDAAELAEVLEDELIGGFGVRVLLNEPGQLLREEIDGFFADRHAEDLLVLYLSCHGIKDAAGQLHFAVTTTRISRLASTGISADFVYEQVDRCRARKILLLLDCCYSGAFPKGYRPRAAGRAEIVQPPGRGRAVITSCTALEYAFEIDSGHVTGGAALPSVFTAAIAEGLRTGEADRDGDGLVSVDDLYGYIFDRVRETTPHQTPEKQFGDIRGEFIIARSPQPPSRPPLPAASDPDMTDRARTSGPARRVVLGLAAASAVGLSITGWELVQQKGINLPGSKATLAPTTLWTRPISAAYFPADVEVAGRIVYVADEAKLYALDAITGRDRWISPLNSQFAVSPPDFGVVYAGSQTGALCALRSSDGRKIWQSRIEFAAGPVIAGGAVYVADAYGRVYALRATDGARLWSFATDQGAPSGVASVRNVVYTAGSNLGAGVWALRAGREIWRSPIDIVVQGPEAANGFVYVTANVGGQERLHALRATDGMKMWTSPIDVAIVSPIFTADRLYVRGGNSGFYALNPHDGKQVWSFPTAAVEGFCLVGNTIYLFEFEGAEIYALRATDGTKRWSFVADNGIKAIAASNDTIYVASNNLYALRAADGTVIWSYPIAAATITVSGSTVYITTITGEAYALRS